MDSVKRNPKLVRSRVNSTERNLVNSPLKNNREQQIRRSDDTIKNFSVGLQDIDETIIYFFRNVINPKVIENGVLIDVPIMYGSPENWFQVKNQGYLRDLKGKIISPVIMFKRTSTGKDTSNPVDKINRNLVYTLPKKWSSKNSYDRFSILNNVRPTNELYNIVVPDYVILNYECVIWTSFVSHTNKIIEQLYYWEGSYWENEKKSLFKTKIDSITQNIDITTDKGRLVRSDFTLEMNGFLIPEIAEDLITTQKSYSPQKVYINSETEIDVASITNKNAQKIIVSTNKPALNSTSYTNVIDAKFNQLLAGITYNRKLKVFSNKTTSGANIENSIITYPLVYTASAPIDLGLTSTNENDFLVFVNGQNVEQEAFSIMQSGSNFMVIIDTGSVGFSLESDDEVITWGKFE